MCNFGRIYARKGKKNLYKTFRSKKYNNNTLGNVHLQDYFGTEAIVDRKKTSICKHIKCNKVTENEKVPEAIRYLSGDEINE